MTDRPTHNIRIDILVDEFITRKRRGEHPTIKEYCVKHPDLAQEIRELLPTAKLIEEFKPEF
jgi:eukaryotic-like serine/threonine-protein kinase